MAISGRIAVAKEAGGGLVVGQSDSQVAKEGEGLAASGQNISADASLRG